MFTKFESPLGIIGISASHQAVTSISFNPDRLPDEQTPNKIIDDCIIQLNEYFSGKRLTFDVPIQMIGTIFQKKVWMQISQIPYGQNVSYGEIAKLVGSPLASQAVGGAAGANNLPIIIPCHRVVGSKGKIGGFSGGLKIKKWLLDHESSNYKVDEGHMSHMV